MQAGIPGAVQGQTWLVQGGSIRCADIGIRPPRPVTEPSSSDEEAFHAQRAIDADKAHMEALIMTAKPNSCKKSTYFSIKHTFVVEPYISQAKNGYLRRMLATFGTGSHWLRVQIGQFDAVVFSCRTCDCSEHEVEDEMHANLVCPTYSSLRTNYADLFGHA